jgi:hypothetical protein
MANNTTIVDIHPVSLSADVKYNTIRCSGYVFCLVPKHFPVCLDWEFLVL